MSDPDFLEQPWVTDRFELQELIGHGGLGDVYRAWDHHLSRAVAVKRMKRHPEQDDRKLAQQTWREAMTTACLQHPHIVTIFDYGHDERGAYVVMELIEGETLEQCLERGPLHMDDFHRFARQSLEGLVAAHSIGLMHRDIKPGNFMLQVSATAPFHVKILDFGLARYVTVPKPQTVDHFNSLLGSIHYMAPEQFLRLPIDQRTDLYSLGCILYEAVTGHTAFDGETISMLIDAHINKQPHPILQLRMDVSPKLERWIMRLMSKEPANRPRSAAEALQTLPALADCSRSSRKTTRGLFPKLT